MKKRKILFTRKIAYLAYCYYKENPVNFSETADYLNSAFSNKYNFNNHDIGRMFRHIVVFGNNDTTARDIVNLVNSRAEKQMPIYNKYLGYRYEYPELIEKYNAIIKLYFYAEKHDFLLETAESFVSSEDENEINEMIDMARTAHDIIEGFDWEEFVSLKNQINLIEKNMITSLF